MKALNNCFIPAATALLVACATQAPAPDTLPARPVAASVPAPTEKLTVPSGYEKVMFKDGEERYCRNDVDTGSRVARSRVCLTAAQLKAVQENSANYLNDVQGRSGLIIGVTGAPPGISNTGRGRPTRARWVPAFGINKTSSGIRWPGASDDVP